MLIGYGKIELLLPELLKQVGDIAGVWAQEEYTLEEARSLERLRKALPDGVKLHLNQSKTLIPPKHLPFNPSDETPDVYTQFRKRVEGLGLHLDGGMLVEPLHTASWSHSKSVDGIDVRVGSKETKLKPFPDVPKGEGWIKKDSELDSAEGMYAALVQPLIDSPPIGGWSSTAKGNRPPSLHSSSAIPFDGGEASALSRLEDYIGHPDGAQEGESSHQNGSRGGQWVGGEKAKSYKSTRNGLLGEAFSTKFASFLALGCLSTREVGWRVGQLLEVVGKDKDTRNNVYCGHLIQHSDPSQMLTRQWQGSYSSYCGETTSNSSHCIILPNHRRSSIPPASPRRSKTSVENDRIRLIGITQTGMTRVTLPDDGVKARPEYRSSTPL